MRIFFLPCLVETVADATVYVVAATVVSAPPVVPAVAAAAAACIAATVAAAIACVVAPFHLRIALVAVAHEEII